MNKVDRKFNSLMNICKSLTHEQMYAELLGLVANARKGTDETKARHAGQFISYHIEYPFWGSVDFLNKDENFLAGRAHMLTAHREDIERVYNLLGDYRSKFIYSEVIASLLNFFNGIKTLGFTNDRIFDEYCDLDFFKVYEKEVFVDCGCFDGANCIQYYQNFGNEKSDNFKFIGYEITASQVPIIEQNLTNAGIKNFDIRHKAVSDENGVLKFGSNETNASANVVSSGVDENSVSVDAVRIDDDIKEPITFLKMDIEGAEQSAIRGAAEHIKNDKPKLGLSIYHSYEDMWKIPLMIDEICPGYRFHLQSKSGNLIPTEITLLCSHPDRD
jgi:FkbM family methyltransferase